VETATQVLRVKREIGNHKRRGKKEIGAFDLEKQRKF